MGQPKTPEEFLAAVREIYSDYPEGGFYDEEAAHGDSDELMENVLESLGYGEGVALIRKAHRWYA